MEIRVQNCQWSTSVPCSSPVVLHSYFSHFFRSKDPQLSITRKVHLTHSFLCLKDELGTGGTVSIDPGPLTGLES